MGLSKTEINLKRLLAAAPQQQNQAKLVHYITTLRELLEQVGAEAAAEGITSISKAKLNEYSEQIEALAAKLATPIVSTPVLLIEPLELKQTEALEIAQAGPSKVKDTSSAEESPSKDDDASRKAGSLSGLRRRFLASRSLEKTERNPESAGRDSVNAVKLDASAQAHIEKHRKLQEDLTDEMVVLARQLKESSLAMNQSLQETEKVLDSTEKAVEHSLATTGHANVRAMEIYSESFKTTCFTWLIIIAMICIFVMVVLLIRVT